MSVRIVYAMATKYFSVETNIADCKSGSNVKIFERLFWVRGVKEYFGALYDNN